MEQNLKWKDVTKTFDEERRYYRNTYLQKCEILPDGIEVSKFIALSENDKDEIYVNFGILNGVAYVPKYETDARYRQIKREIKIWKELSKYENIVELRDFEFTENHTYVVMEYCEEGTLLDLVNNHEGNISEVEALLIFNQVLFKN